MTRCSETKAAWGEQFVHPFPSPHTSMSFMPLWSACRNVELCAARETHEGSDEEDESTDDEDTDEELERQSVEQHMRLENGRGDAFPAIGRKSATEAPHLVSNATSVEYHISITTPHRSFLHTLCVSCHASALITNW